MVTTVKSKPFNISVGVVDPVGKLVLNSTHFIFSTKRHILIGLHSVEDRHYQLEYRFPTWAHPWHCKTQ